MPFTLGLAQVAHPTLGLRSDSIANDACVASGSAGVSVGDVVRQVRQYVQSAVEKDCDLVVFPESLMGPWDPKTHSYVHAPEPLDGPFCKAINAIACEFGVWLVYTTEEENPSDLARPYNTAVVTDSCGIRRAAYRKTHLYDAIGERESDRMTAGDTPAPVIEAPFCHLGVAICYDLRFPEVARRMALEGAELILFPSAWVAGPHKIEQWRTLLTARAIENECFVAGVSRTGGGRCGNSLVVNPLGEPLATGAAEECLLTCPIDLAEIERARKAMPIFEHRRPELYL